LRRYSRQQQLNKSTFHSIWSVIYTRKAQQPVQPNTWRVGDNNMDIRKTLYLYLLSSICE